MKPKPYIRLHKNNFIDFDEGKLSFMSDSFHPEHLTEEQTKDLFLSMFYYYRSKDSFYTDKYKNLTPHDDVECLLCGTLMIYSDYKGKFVCANRNCDFSVKVSSHKPFKKESSK